MVALFTLILKIIRLFDKLVSDKNNNSKLISNKNNNNKLTFKNIDNNGGINRFNINENGIEYAKKLEKLFKLKKSKSEKIFKSQNFAKLEKKLLKSRNSINFGIIKVVPKFLNPNTSIAFNCLWLAFIKALIL